MNNVQQTSFEPMVNPSKSSGGLLKLVVVTGIVVTFTSLGAYWLFLDNEDKIVIKDVAKSTVTSIVKDTPLESTVDDYFRKPLPNFVTKPKTTPGTMSGQMIKGHMSIPFSVSRASLGSVSSIKGAGNVTNTSNIGEKNTSARISKIQIFNQLKQEPSANEFKSFLAETKRAQNTPSRESIDQVILPDIQKLTQTQVVDVNKRRGHNLNQGSTDNIQSGLSAGHSMENATTVGMLAAPPRDIPLTPTLEVNEDTVISKVFVDDIVAWLVYRHINGFSFSIASINARYGLQMQALLPPGSEDAIGARYRVLRYVFNASMLRALYNLYVEHFVASMITASQMKNIKGNMLQNYADQFYALGGLLQGIGSLDDFKQRMQSVRQTEDETLKIYKEVTEAVHELDNVRFASKPEDTTNSKALQEHIESLTARYQSSIQERNLARQALVKVLRENSQGVESLRNERIFYVAQWLERRLSGGMSAQDIKKSATTAGELLQDLSSRLLQKPNQEQALEQNARPKELDMSDVFSPQSIN